MSSINDLKNLYESVYNEGVSFDIGSGHRMAQKKEKIANLAKSTTNPGEKAAAENKLKGPKLPEIKKEQVELGEDHWDPVTKTVGTKKRTGSDPAIRAMAAKAAASGPKKRKPLGTSRKSSGSFNPSSPDEAKASIKSWDDYWSGAAKGYKEEVEIDEEKKKGLWSNIHAKRKRGERPAKPGEKGYPKTLNIEEGIKQARKNVGASKCWTGKKLGNPPTKMKGGKEVPNCVPAEEYVLERHMTSAEKAKEEKIGKKTEESTLPAMIQQYGKVKGTQVYYAWKRKQAMKEAFVDPETGETPSGRSPIENVSYHPKKSVRKKAMGAFAKQMGKEYGGKWKAKTKDPTVGENFEDNDLYDYIIETLVDSEFAKDFDAAEVMLEYISDEFVNLIVEEYIEEKARGTRKKSTLHAYDVDETLFSHGKKGKPNVQVHVNDSSGKRVKSLSNQEFNTHKLEKGHSYDFSEFQSAKKFKETSSPNKKVIKHLQKQVKRGENVHLITARSKFDDPKEFHGHLKKHGINVPLKNIHYTGGMKGKDIGDKKVKVANAIAKQSGTTKTHMYDDAAKVHKSFEKEKAEHPTTKKIKTHLIKPNKSGEPTSRSYQATKEEMTAYEYWKQFINENTNV